MVADENARFAGIEARCADNFKFGAGQAKNIAEENALRPVVLARIDEDAKKNQKRADDRKVNSADRPQKRRSNRKIRISHTIASSADGRISSERHSKHIISPSIITFTGRSICSSMLSADDREARGSFICVPVKSRGSILMSPRRLIGPQRTYSIRPSVASALGAIIILPPVNLLLLKERKRAGRRSHSPD